jgi:predicted secreted protein
MVILMVALTVTPQDAGSTLQVRAGDTVGVLLPENPDSGHIWSWWVPDGVRVLSAELDLTAQPGRQLQRRVLLGVRQVGKYTVVMQCRLPWESAPEQTITFVLDAA